MLRTLYRSFRTCGIDPVAFGRKFPQLVRLYRQRRAFPGSTFYPMLGDAEDQAGHIGGHYFHQDLWAARKIFERRPPSHIDVGSALGGFVSHLLVFMSVTVLDVRPLETDAPGLTFVQGDATDMRDFEDNSVESLSSLHAVEHFGLGRYGDPLDPEGHVKAMRSFARVLAPRGRLYFSVPVGRERVEFNAHRVLSPQTILSTFKDLSLVSFSAVGDDARLYLNVEPERFSSANLACGLFEFTKQT